MMTFELLCYQVSHDGIQPFPSKVAALNDMEALGDIAAIHLFLRTAGYYRQCILNFAETALPLTVVTTKRALFH